MESLASGTDLHRVVSCSHLKRCFRIRFQVDHFCQVSFLCYASCASTRSDRRETYLPYILYSEMRHQPILRLFWMNLSQRHCKGTEERCDIHFICFSLFTYFMLVSLDCPVSVICCCCWYGSCLTLRLQKVTFTSKHIIDKDLTRKKHP